MYNMSSLAGGSVGRAAVQGRDPVQGAWEKVTSTWGHPGAQPASPCHQETLPGDRLASAASLTTGLPPRVSCFPHGCARWPVQPGHLQGCESKLQGGLHLQPWLF